MLRDREAFLRYVTLIAVRFYLLTYLLFVLIKKLKKSTTWIYIVKDKMENCYLKRMIYWDDGRNTVVNSTMTGELRDPTVLEELKNISPLIR